MLRATIVQIVSFCTRFAAAVVGVALILGVSAAFYASRHFSVNTDVNSLISPDLAWRKREIAYETAFPQTVQSIIAVVEGPSPEMTSAAADALVQRLSGQTNLFQSVQDIGGGSFFTRNGLLFLSPAELATTTRQLVGAAPFIRILAADQSFRGFGQALSIGLQGVQARRYSLNDMAGVLDQASETLETTLAGRRASFSWKVALAQRDLEPTEVRHLISIWAKLDYAALEPGSRATEAIRAAAKGLPAEFQSRVRLTGPVPFEDQEFATLQEGVLINGVVSVLIVVLVLWLALRSWRTVLAVLVNLSIGLVVTSAIALILVGQLNPISVAFAVLFVGLGADFAIQFSVRYRAQRHVTDDLHQAIHDAAERIGAPLTLAAAAAAIGFLSFMPTSYAGLSELGLIAGCGMGVAFLASLTLLPALLVLLAPPQEPRPIGYAALAPADRFLQRHRIKVVAGTCIVVAAALPLLINLQFDFNPLHLRNPNDESIAAYRELAGTAGVAGDAADVLVQSSAEAATVRKELAAVPEVEQTRTVADFVPSQQEEKLATVARAASQLDPALQGSTPHPEETDQARIAALRQAAQQLIQAADEDNGAGADAARRLANALARLADGDADLRAQAEGALVRPLAIDLSDLREEVHPARVMRANVPQALQRMWIAPDGRERVEIVPKRDANGQVDLHRFATAVLAKAPTATGPAIETFEWASTMITAFVQAGIWAICGIAILLWIVLRRVGDVFLTLAPLLVAAVVTLEICAATNFSLNYANIIALPALLGIGVAFKIYYVIAWRAGEANFLQSPLTRAVFFSALMTATAFGSLWLSNNPGMSSMGKLLMLSLGCTLASAALFQPALMGPPRQRRQAQS